MPDRDEGKKIMEERILTEMDKLYYELYGEIFKKQGTAFERLVAVAICLLTGNDVLYDQFVCGISGTRHQIDGILKADDGDVMVEAKDYEIRNVRVGYGDIAKMEGTLTDTTMTSGILASATDFTNSTRLYAKGTQTNPNQIPVVLYDVRKPTIEDRIGRIEDIILRFNIVQPDITPYCFKLVFTEEGERLLSKNILKANEEARTIQLKLEKFYDKKGIVRTTIKQISDYINSLVNMKDEKQIVIEGAFDLDGQNIKLEDVLYPVKEVTFKVPVLRGTIEKIIKGGKPILLVKSSDKKCNKILTKEELQNYRFNNGKMERGEK